MEETNLKKLVLTQNNEEAPPLRIAYLILAHKSLEQVTRLVNSINSKNADFFIHIDKKCNNQIFSQLKNNLKDLKNVFFVDRISCSWGKFSIVEATIEGIKTIVHSSISYDYVILLSGQDYPIKPVSYIECFFKSNNGKCFIRNSAVRNNWLHGESVRMPAKYSPNKEIIRYRGSQWWCLPNSCVRYINDFIKSNPQFVKYFSEAYIPDESFFQTVVLNSPFKPQVINDGLRYMDWRGMSSHPATLTKKHIPILSSSPSLFARKFDINVDSEILDMIDRDLLLT